MTELGMFAEHFSLMRTGNLADLVKHGQILLNVKTIKAMFGIEKSSFLFLLGEYTFCYFIKISWHPSKRTLGKIQESKPKLFEKHSSLCIGLNITCVYNTCYSHTKGN